MRRKKQSEMDINERCRALPVLRTQKVEWSRGGKNGNVITLSYPIYGDDVKRWIDMFYESELGDRNYIDNSKLIKDKDIDRLTRDETLTRMTHLIRGERFCDGVIAKALENGELEALCVHLNEITK